MQNEFKYKNDYQGFLAKGPEPQEVIDFIVYVGQLPSPTLEDIEARIAACLKVKNRSERIKKLGYWYDSQFIIYEQLFWDYNHEFFEKSLESFQKATNIGLEASQVLRGNDATTMGVRTEVLLRYPQKSGYSPNFKDIQKANTIKQKRLQGKYFDQTNVFNHFREIDLIEARNYAVKGTREYFYCSLYLDKNPQALQYFQKKWKESPHVSIGCNLLHGLEYLKPQEAQAFTIELEEFVQKSNNAEGFTHLARMDLRKYSHTNGFVVIPNVLAGMEEPTRKDAERSIKHCDLGLQKISKIPTIGPYEYRNKVFLYETKGWVYAHLMPKTFSHYCESIKNYKQAISLYVNVKEYHKQLQFATTRYHHIAKEVVQLFTVPNNFAFDNKFKFQLEAHRLYKEYQTMFIVTASNSQGFPYIKQLQLLFKMGAQMQTVKNVKNDIFQQKQVELIDFMAKVIENSAKEQQEATKNELTKLIDQNRTEGEQLEEILNDQQLNAYYEGFMRTFADSYNASVNVMQDLFVLEVQKAMPIKIITFLTSMIPLIGDQVSTAVGGVLEYIDNQNTKARASHISKIAPSSTRLDALAQSLVIKIINDQRLQIKNLENQLQLRGKKSIPFVDRILMKVKQVQQKLFDMTELFDSCEKEMGNRHASLLIESMIANGQLSKIKKATPALRIRALQEYMLAHQQEFLIKVEEQKDSKVGDKAIQASDAQRNKYSNKGPCSCMGNGSCLIYSQQQIVYDNPLLNHPELLKIAARSLGMDQAITYSQKIPAQSIKDVIDNNNGELLLALLLSLQNDL